ncbi:iron chelate uptake ABC transporter family permease subunit [Vibrio rhizosphaerae]|uniref:iron chelate uptake ABC transporter family permease subunit n=1 Tax=Vibrio rhizosphaerae TaxID=398736 RepID=UPI00056E9694|nr:iron chelate uptake ABC transporter family permease subunit [Vibrio rhizosphaerae]
MNQQFSPSRTSHQDVTTSSRSAFTHEPRFSLSGKLMGLIAALMILATASLFIGAKSISPGMVVDGLLAQANTTESLIIIESRLPRTLTGLLVGAALAVAGCLIQSITRNPLADPGILGVNAGASFFVLTGIILLGNHSMAEHLWLAFFGAMFTSIFVYFVGTYKEARVNPLKITLAGIAIGALLAGIASSMTLMNPEAFDAMRFWDAGSLDIRDRSLALMAVLPVLAGVITALAIAPALDNLSLGEDIAQGLGTHVRLVQLSALFAIALLCGSATAIAGPIGFIGLMIPHIARRLSGPNQLWLTLYAIVLGPLLLISADMVGRVIAVNEIRVSIVTAFVGAPVLIYLARQVTSFGKL